MLITFEGPEGAGKSTAIQAVADLLRTLGRQVVVTREPGSGEFGKKVRSLLLEDADIGSKSELFLFLADRAHHVETLIKPELQRGTVVLCDRYADSTLVYQGYARGLDRTIIRSLNEFATGGLVPDVTLLFDVEPEVGLARIEGGDRLDREPIEFHHRVRAGFLREAHYEPRRWVIIDASQPPELVLKNVLRIIQERIAMDSRS
jgi:dTMP kinase